MADKLEITARPADIGVSIGDALTYEPVAHVMLPEVPRVGDRIRLRTAGVEHAEAWVVVSREWAIATDPGRGLVYVSVWVRKDTNE